MREQNVIVFIGEDDVETNLSFRFLMSAKRKRLNLLNCLFQGYLKLKRWSRLSKLD